MPLPPTELPPLDPHLFPRVTYFQDPSSSLWRIDVSRTAHLPSPAHPNGLLPSAADPFPPTAHWLRLTDTERDKKAQEHVRNYETWVEMRPVSPFETRAERRRRTMSGGDEEAVDAFQRKEAILEAGREQEKAMRGRRESMRKEREIEAGKVITRAWSEVKRNRSGSGGADPSGSETSPKVEMGIGRAAVEHEVRQDVLPQAIEGEEDVSAWAKEQQADAHMTSPSTAHVDHMQQHDQPPAILGNEEKHDLVSDGVKEHLVDAHEPSPFTEDVIAVHERINEKRKARDDAQLRSDLAGTVLMLVGFLWLYIMVAGCCRDGGQTQPSRSMCSRTS